MDLYAAFCTRVLVPTWESGLRGRPTLGLLRSLERTQYRSTDELVAQQVVDLRRLLDHASLHVPFYRDRLRALGVTPADIRTLEDLHALPIVTRTEARLEGDARRSTVPPFATIAKSTSGSSGEPLAFAYDETSEHWRQAIKRRGYGWAKQAPGVRTVYYWGMGGALGSRTKRAKIAIDRALRRETYVDCASRSEEALAHAVRVVARQRPDVFVCFAQAGAELARYVLRSGTRTWPDMRVVCGAEELLETDRTSMQQAFGPHVFNSYGSREVMLMGMECEAHDGLHLSMENLIVEVVVREGSKTRAARAGESGEVVVTDLHNFGMPFIRYANGDMAVAGSAARCACGRSLPRLASIDGRVAQTMRDATGARVSGLAICSVIAHLGHAVEAFQTVQHRDGSVTLKLVTTPAFDESARTHLVRSLSPYFKGLPFRVDPVSDLPVPASGKRSIVVVEAHA